MCPRLYSTIRSSLMAPDLGFSDFPKKSGFSILEFSSFRICSFFPCTHLSVRFIGFKYEGRSGQNRTDSRSRQPKAAGSIGHDHKLVWAKLIKRFRKISSWELVLPAHQQAGRRRSEVPRTTFPISEFCSVTLNWARLRTESSIALTFFSIQ